MSFTVIIHAGAGKCGSTTIQRFLLHNAEALHEAGVAFVSSTDFTVSPRNQGTQFGGSFPLEYFAAQGAAEAGARQNLLASLEECEAAGKRFAIISAENALATVPALAHRLPMFFEHIVDRFDVKLVAYVRRPEEWLVSAWKQWGMKATDPADWLAQCCLNLQPSFGAGLEAWKLALGGNERIYCNILAGACLAGGNILRDFQMHTLGDLPVELRQTPNANLSPPAAWLRLLSENRATLFSSGHDNGFEQFLETLIAGDDGRERNVDEILTAEGRARIIQFFRQDIERLVEGFIPDKVAARKYFRLDQYPSQPETTLPGTAVEMAEYLRGALLPQDTAAIEQAFRAVMLGAIYSFDRRLSAMADHMHKQAEAYANGISLLHSAADKTAEIAQSLRQEIDQLRMPKLVSDDEADEASTQRLSAGNKMRAQRP